MPADLLSNNHDVSDATQRVYIDTNDQISDAPVRHSAATGHTGRTGYTGHTGRTSNAAERRSAVAREKKRRQRVMLITICAIAAIVLIGVLILLVSLRNRQPADNGLIHDNVFAAGVNLSGMTTDEAKEALHAATDDTYTDLDMTISILDTVVTLSPADTGALLDVDAVVEAAYNCGRTGSGSDSYTVSIVPYLNLNTAYIETVIDALGEQYGTTLTQTTYEVEGTAPNMEREEYDTSVAYQNLLVHIGTAEYGLNTDTLYEQIMDAYEINLFEVSCQCTVVAPDALDYELIYSELCTKPVNAELDTATYEVTPEIYGYGFTLDELKTAVEAGAYGTTVTVPMHFIEPDITAEFYTGEMFQDTLSYYSTSIPSASGWKTNLQLVCEALNGTILKAGEEFSFNDIIGQPTSGKGYQSVGIYVGKSYQEVVGGGISQAASTLYYCALMADLEILERSNHAYTVGYIQNGFDAEVSYGSLDLRFRNTTESPIRIDASVEDGQFKITLIGTDTKEYYVRLSYETDATYKPETVYNTMLEGNAGGYTDGTILTTGTTGYLISTYLVKYDISNNRLIEERLVAESYYAKRDQVVVKIYVPPVVEDPTDSTDPSETTPPETTIPPETTVPPETTIPDETTPPETTVPPETTTPPETTEATEVPDPSESNGSDESGINEE